jgi:hypothetical protein
MFEINHALNPIYIWSPDIYAQSILKKVSVLRCKYLNTRPTRIGNIKFIIEIK